jgi:hypothetical protein
MHAKCLLHRDEVTAHKKRRTFFGLMPQGRSANNCCYQLLRNCFLNGWMLPEGWPTRLPAKKFRAENYARPREMNPCKQQATANSRSG